MVDYKAIPLEVVELKAGSDGWAFSAYASTFNDRDLGGDVILPGAFDKTLKTNAFRPLLWQHDLREPIGIETSLKTDRKGLLGTWDLIDTQRGQDAYKLLKRGAVRSMSIGYIPEGFEFQDEGQTRVLKEIALIENSVVSVPMNPDARVQSVKHLCAGCEVELGMKAEWTAAFINGLPDSAFAYIEPGGTKDSEGKTTPRSKRHFPHHGAGGGVDLPHLRNALSRAPQSPFGDKAMAHLERHARSEGVGDSGKGFPELDLNVSFDEMVAQLKGYLMFGVDEAEALHARRREEQRELTPAHIDALELLSGELKGSASRIEAILRAVHETPPAKAIGGLHLRLELARRRLRAAGVE